MNTDFKWMAGFFTAMVALGGAASALAHDGTARKIDYARAKATPFGKAADPARAAKVIAIEMADTMRFTPAQITVRRGDTVRFVATNSGQVMHEMVLGTMKDLKEHAEHMRQHPDMEHDEPHMLHVGPGKTAEMGWQFTRAGEFFYGCLVPGHFEAGMLGTIKVTE